MANSGAREQLQAVSEYAVDYQQLMFRDNLQQINLTWEDLHKGGPHPPFAFLLRWYLHKAKGVGGACPSLTHSAFRSLELGASDPVPPDLLWEECTYQYKQHGLGESDWPDEETITGLADFANRHGNLFQRIQTVVEGGGGLRVAYLELISITGIGRVLATTILRDIVWYWDFERVVAVYDREYLHPIDRWTGRIATTLWPEAARLSESETAQQIAAACDEHNISHAEFSQGASYLGTEVLDGDAAALEDWLRAAAES